MLDAASGRRLWSAGPDKTNDFALAKMTHAIAARIATLDIDGDGFADRLYTADVGGRLWRFDIWNGHTRDQLVTGGVLANLGGEGRDARRFFAAPDVALMQPRGQEAWYNLAIGSGDGDDVRLTTVLNRFYSLRDRDPFTKRSQADYDAASPILDADLTPVTTVTTGVPNESPGWKVDLGAGEQVLAESVTANGIVMFTTHEPSASLDGSLCASDADTNRVYALRIESAAAALDLNNDTQVNEADRSAVLEQKGIAPGVRIETPGPGQGTPATPLPETPPNAVSGTPACLVGVERLTQCIPLDTVLRTFWKRTTAN
jgi:type IV pilus assembly protein PilY1